MFPIVKQYENSGMYVEFIGPNHCFVIENSFKVHSHKVGYESKSWPLHWTEWKDDDRDGEE